LGFRFSEAGETVYLYASDGQGRPGALVDRVQFGASPNGVSLGRYLASGQSFPLQRAITLGSANAGPLVGPLVIAVIMYHPSASGDEETSEYIVITNRSAVSVALYDSAHPENTWKVSGLGNDNTEYALPGNLVLSAGASLVVASAPDAFRSAHPSAAGIPVVGPFPGKLSNEGERLALMQPQPPDTDAGAQANVAYAELDIVEYGVSSPWPPEADGQGQALVRLRLDEYGDDPMNWGVGNWNTQPAELSFLPLIVQ
jgi:hypothetical protein